MLAWLLAQADPNQAAIPGAAPSSIPVDEGAFGLCVVLATLITLVVMVLICSPIRRD